MTCLLTAHWQRVAKKREGGSANSPKYSAFSSASSSPKVSVSFTRTAQRERKGGGCRVLMSSFDEALHWWTVREGRRGQTGAAVAEISRAAQQRDRALKGHAS